MDIDQRVAYVFSQSVAAMAEIEAMKAENSRRLIEENNSPTYGEKAFMDVAVRYGLDTNTVMPFLQGR